MTIKDIKNFDVNEAKKICHFPGWDISSSYIAAPLNGGDLVEHLYKRNTKLDYLCFIFLTAPTMKSTENLFCSQKLAINVFGLHAHFNNCPSQNFFRTFFCSNTTIISQKEMLRKIRSLFEKFHFKFEITFLSDNWKDEAVFERKV